MGRIERALEHANRKPTKEREKSGDNSTRLAINTEEADVNDPGIDIGKLTKIELDPKKLFQQHRVIMNAQDSIASSAYKILRTRVLQRMRSNGWQTLAVTGTCPNEGKTLTAINLALSMARDVNTTTVLADLDLRRPTIHKYLDYKPRYGVLDCLNDRATIETAMVCPGLERLGLLLNSEPLESSSEMLASPKMSPDADRAEGRRGPDRYLRHASAVCFGRRTDVRAARGCRTDRDRGGSLSAPDAGAGSRAVERHEYHRHGPESIV